MHHGLRSREARRAKKLRHRLRQTTSLSSLLVVRQGDVSRKLNQAFLLVDSFNFNFVDEERSDIKVHKKDVPGRPVVSACGSATEGMSEIVDFFLQPYLPTIPSFIKDTDDLIRRIRNIIELPSDVLLVTVDVVSLYRSIPHDFGL